MIELTLKNLIIIKYNNKHHPTITVSYKTEFGPGDALIRIKENYNDVTDTHNSIFELYYYIEDNIPITIAASAPIEMDDNIKYHLDNKNILFDWLKDNGNHIIKNTENLNIINLDKSDDLLYDFARACWVSETNNYKYGKRVSEEDFKWYRKIPAYYEYELEDKL